MADTTTIQVLNSQWTDLNAAKEAPGESMKDALARVLDVYKTVQENNIDLDSLVDDDSAVDESPAEETPVDLEGDSGRERAPREDVVDDRDVATDERTDVEGEPVTGAQRAAIEDAIDTVASEKWDDSPDRIDARKDAARAASYYLAQQGTASKKEVKREVKPDAPVDGQNDRTWYRKNVREVFNEIAEYDSSEREYRIDTSSDGDR